MGHLSQMMAGTTHHVSPARLQEIAKTIPHVMIVTGDDDNLVDPRNSEYLAAQMPEARYEKWEGTGHGIHGQWPERFNRLLEEVFHEGKKRVDEGWRPRM
jgi:pimeloyl-ACP methyl ester carboxylesterase